MVKGAQKRMVVLRTSDSGLYEQAYFVLRDKRGQAAPDERSMIAEANRILSESLLPTQQKKKRSHRGAPWLLFGALLGAALASALWLLLLH